MNDLEYFIEIKLKNRFDEDYDSFFNFVKKNWAKLLIIIICALFYSFGQVQFLLKAAIVSDGVEAISISMAHIFPILKPFLTILYLGLNIPLVIYFWKKVKKPFMVSTVVFLCFNAIFGFLFSLEPIDTFISEKLIVLIDNPWDLANGKIGTTNFVAAGWPIFIYSVLAVAFCSPTSAIVWKIGSSTGGIDLIAYYISTKLKKPVGNFLVLTGTLMAFIGILTLFVCKRFASENFIKGINGFEHLFGAQTFATYSYILLNGFIINLIYPRYKKVKLRIDTKNISKVEEYLSKINYWHPYQVKTSISGYTKESVYSIESVVLLLESDEIAMRIKEVAPDAWISLVPVSKIYGSFNYSKVD